MMSNIFKSKTKDKRMGELKSSLKIYCRIRPLDDASDFNCVVQKSEKTVILVPFDGSQKSEKGGEVCYSFQRVFNEGTIQKEIFDHVAYPLVQDLLQGESGVIFTHGVTSSGKTYTMTGTPDDEGLIPRSLDVIFNTIEDSQASKFVFKSNEVNGFEVQPIAEALMDQQKHLGLFSRTSTPKRTDSIGEWSDRVSDSYIVDGISACRKYSVFITYIEIYNNYIYDLLEDVTTDRKDKKSSSKMLREDLAHNMYVFGAVESEVKTANEALELFCRGQLRRRFSNTDVNNKSSRSHTVFTIRVVQAPVHPRDSEIELNQDNIVVSQLSFVDLASCERTLGTQNGTRKSYETGSKNTTLVALSSCIEVLKKLQSGKTSKTVPYNKSRLTHLFKMFFEGRGQIRMIVCLNPRFDDCNETANFMKFAKKTEEFPPEVPAVPKTLARKSDRSNTYREVIQKAKQQGVKVTKVLVPDDYTNLSQFKPIFDDESSHTNLVEILMKRKSKRKSCKQDLKRRQEEFRKNLIAIEKENIHLKEDKQLLEMDLRAREQQLHGAEHKLSSAEQMIEILEKDLTKAQDSLQDIRMELHNKDKIIVDQAKEIDNVKTRMKEKLASEKLRLKQTMERRLAAKQTEIERKMCFNAERFRQLREILNTDDWANMEDIAEEAEQSTETSTSATETSEAKAGKDRCWSLSRKTTSRKKRHSSNIRSRLDFLPACKTKKSSRFDQKSSKKSLDAHLERENEDDVSIKSISSQPRSKPTSSRTSVKKLSMFIAKHRPTTNHVPDPTTASNDASTTSVRNAICQFLLRGSCSKFFKSERPSSFSLSKYGRRKFKSNKDDVWIEHCPIENLELSDDFGPAISKKRTVSSLTMKDVIKKDTYRYVLQHQEVDNGRINVEWYKADINPTKEGVQVVFKDVVKMLTSFPQNPNLKRLGEKSVSPREVEERCTISIECHGIPPKNMKKK